jgi:acetyl/propionyl-CoA carboxylase alpha subunit
MFKKILIANRGEIASRVARTCKRMGMETVAVYSDADADSPHLASCDEAVRIGPTDVHESYLNIQALLSAADATGSDAIHPGYGMLSESPEFSRAVSSAGITFVGPSAEIMEKMLDRAQARALAINSGVRALDGSDVAFTELAPARAFAEELGYPLMIKPVKGGLRVGPCRVEHADDFESAWASHQQRAISMRGEPRFILERALDRPRHVDVQVVADEQDVVAVWDRECSIQRNGNRLVYEAPAPALSGTERGERVRDAIFDAAVRIIREAGYTGVGAVEFLIDAAGEAHFLELRPRLAVAHATTEMCANIDLVEAQIEVAAGRPIPEDIKRGIPSGHAIEVRLTTEQPNRGFQPATGTVQDIRWPNASPGRLRIEASVQIGTKVKCEYDAILAKVITHAPTRHAALLLLDRVLAESAVVPLATNAVLLRKVLAHESFRAGQYDVSFLDHLIGKK